MPRKVAQRQRAKPHSKNHGRDRQRRKPFVRREDCTDDAGSRNNHRIVSARKRLCDRQDYGVAPREIVVGLDVLEGFGRGRH